MSIPEARRLVRVLDEDRTEIIDIGQGRAADDQGIQLLEKSVTVVVLQVLLRIEVFGLGLGMAFRSNPGTSIVFRTVDTVGIAGERVDAGFPLSSQSKERMNSVFGPPAPLPLRVTEVSPPERISAGGGMGC